jgi:DNA-binding NarL/FixJ family response regulator
VRPVLKGSGKNLVPRPGSLPPRMRVLYVTTYQRTGGWLAEALAADSASDVVLEEAVGFAAGLARLRDDVFDAVLVGHEPGELDALALAETLRTAGCEEPFIVLGEQDEAEMTALCLEANADAYLCVHATTTRTLMWIVSRAIERHYLLRENRRLEQADRHRLELEQGDAVRLLADERGLVRDLDYVASCCRSGTPCLTDNSLDSAADNVLLDPATLAHEQRPRLALPRELENHYRELLRTYVMMGSGNLATEMHALAQLLAAAGVSAAQTLDLHIHVLENLLQGLGNRSARHVMTRADLLALEIAAHLCEAYRQRCAGVPVLEQAPSSQLRQAPE